MTACGEEEEDGGGDATIIFKNASSVTANYVAVIGPFNSAFVDETSANIAPGAEKSYKIKPVKTDDYLIYMGASGTNYGATWSSQRFENGKTYTATWSGGNGNSAVTVE
jgi:hypothetical protein